MKTTRITAGLGAIATATALLAGCAATTITPPSVPAENAVVFEHFHELVPDPSDGSLLVATHQGLYRLRIGSNGSAVADGPIGGLDFDPMGFTLADGIAYASGHPGPTTPDTFGSPNLGLITSTDLGQTWKNVSLTGVTDFHGLTVATSDSSTPRVFGYDGSQGRILTSPDSGTTWVDGAELAPRDILAVGDLLYATTADGLAVSSDNGMSFTIDATAPALYVIAADTNGALAGVDTTGTLWIRAVGGEWVHGRTVQGVPQAFAVDGDRIYIADDRGIAYTDDAGVTWVVLQVTQ
ncbi:MAG: hypothetical protein KF727_14030 [Microbacteriaceae bacterium]|jgi:hypothetical protein|nr:hypothetical protein [Microbacteriaceae bacterium]